MKIELAQLNYTIGDFEGNTAKIINSINRARNNGADLVVFAEQAISGTPAYDLVNKVTFLELCEDALIEIAACCDNISAIIGLPIAHNNETISAAAFIQNRQIVSYIGKKTIDSRDELMHISPSKGCQYVEIGDTKVAIAVGLDLKIDGEFDEYIDTIINIAARQYSRGIIDSRYDILKKLAYTTGKNVVFINQVGGQTDVIYDGSSAVFNKKGEPIAILKSFDEDQVCVDLDGNPTIIERPYQNKTTNVYNAIKLGLKDYFIKNELSKAVVGLSGGIDSALVFALAVEVLGAKNVKALLMPSKFSSEHSIKDASQMAENLGVNYNVIPINEAYTSVIDSMIPVLGGTDFDSTEENIQSRIRCIMLMAMTNKYGYVVLNTSNKSEIAVGHGALYGNLSGALGIIADLYKIEVYDIARYINREREVIPQNIIEKEPSSELRLNENLDKSKLPPYDVLDAILYRMIEKGQHREEIINAGFDADVVNYIHSCIVKNEHKRYQGCPKLRLSTCVFGIDRILPLTNKYGY